MLIKALIIVIGFSVLCRWALGRWPWDFLRAPPIRAAALVRARRLIGVEPGAGRDEIIAAHRRLTTQVHPDKGGSTVAMQQANAARDLLLADLPGPPIGAADDDRPPPSQD